jgi:phosphoglycolate phosphatase
MLFKAVTFDLDGTLLDTLEDIAFSANTVLKEHGHPTFDVPEYRYFVGDGVFVLFQRTLPESHRDEKTIMECARLFRDVYQKNPNKKIRPYDGVEALLRALTERGIRLAILSNKPHELARNAVRDFLPSSLFDLVLGQRDSIPPKPDPRGAIEIADHLDISTRHFIYLGDTAVDMQTAVRANMFPVGVLWGFRDKRELEENGARIVIDHPLDLLRFMDGNQAC